MTIQQLKKLYYKNMDLNLTPCNFVSEKILQSFLTCEYCNSHSCRMLYVDSDRIVYFTCCDCGGYNTEIKELMELL